MDIPIGVNVLCTDGRCGRSSRILLNPIQQKITHLVIGADSVFGDRGRIVPLDQVLATTPEVIRLRCAKDDVLKMDEFIKVHYVENGLLGAEEEEACGLMQAHNLDMHYHDLYDSDNYMLWSYVAPDIDSPYVAVEEEQIPIDEIAVYRGADIDATDGRVGQVDEFMIDPSSGHITHLVMKKGHLWGKKDITLPLLVVGQMREYSVELTIDKGAIAALPQISVRRFHKVAH